VRETVFNILLYTVALAVAGSAGALGGVVYVRHQTPPPRIVILDIHHLAEAVIKDPTLSESDRAKRISQIGTSVSQVVGRYAQQGAIVLDASAVLRAPQDAYLEP
jgi:hypothetical protein